ncbi:MAG: ABC-2 transporter permease [Clostridia bacterium]|nr:ABC-2 transporter permease [Clostridia bacterium]
MLGKLMKYDMKYMARVLPWLYLGAFGMSLIFTLLGILSARSGMESLLVTVLLGIIPVMLMLAALSVCSTVFMMVRIYKNMFSDEGYLTFTLPVRSREIVWSKLLVGAIWNLIGSIVTVAVVAMPITAVFVTLARTYPEFASEISGYTEIFGSLIDAYSDVPGFVSGLISILLHGFVSLFSTNALFMLSCCLAQLLNKNRGIASVGIYLGLNFLLSSITSFSSRITVTMPADIPSEVYIPELGPFYTVTERFSATSYASVIITAIVTGLAIFFSCRIVKKNLNMV